MMKTENLAIVAITTVFQVGMVSFIKQNLGHNPATDTVLYAYIFILSVVCLSTLWKVKYTYWDNLDKYTLRHLRWNLLNISITYAYIIIGNIPLAIGVAVAMAVFQAALFYGENERPMTWEDLGK